jgi:hypothetical protein
VATLQLSLIPAAAERHPDLYLALVIISCACKWTSQSKITSVENHVTDSQLMQVLSNLIQVT